MTESRARIRDLALGIVREVTPEDIFVVEEGFDQLADDWDAAESQDEGRLLGIEASTFAGVIARARFVYRAHPFDFPGGRIR